MFYLDPQYLPTTSVDIFVNCIYLSQPIPKFLTNEFIAKAGKSRRLSVVVDVSCE
jgi:saccharopine dehydrogenase (NAD+, L-lysine-forming)